MLAPDVMRENADTQMTASGNGRFVGIVPATLIPMTHVDFYCRLLLRNLLQQQKSIRNHAKMQLQQNAQQTRLQVTQTTMLF